MIPLRDDNPTRTTPVVTFVLLALNVVAFLYQWLVIGLNTSALQFGLIPAELVHNANTTYLLRGPGGTAHIQNFEPAWATLFFSMFMHGNWLHILSNMWYLWIFGNNVEDALGRMRFLLFYLASGLAAAGAQIMMGSTEQVPMVGASGAVAGVLGAYLVLFPGSRVLCLTTWLIITTMYLPASLVLGLWIVLQVVSQIGALGMQHSGGGVAYAAHIGGFAFGWLVVRFLHREHERVTPAYSRERDYVDWR